MKRLMFLVIHAGFAGVLSVAAAGPAAMDLAGSWRFALDPADAGIKCGPDTWKFPDVIKLPGVLTAQGFGDAPSFKTAWTGDGWRYPKMFVEWQSPDNFKFPYFLQPPKHFVGPAWYQRDIEIPGDWKNLRAVLRLERVHWHSTCWLDGKEAGKGDSLGTAHEFDLGVLAPGRHVLTLRIDNRIGEADVGALSHSVTDHTQGNWNGVVGKIEIYPVSLLRIARARVYSSSHNKVKVTVDLSNNNFDPLGGSLRVMVSDPATGVVLGTAGEEISYPRGTTPEGGHILVTSDRKTLECTLKAKAVSWNEFSPKLYQVKVEVRSGKDVTDTRVVSFGFRDVGTKDGRITLDGQKIFLRGTLECCIFPLTGYPPTEVAAWRRIVGICKAHGLNHIRFHSWCPPEAAFIAADELGFYYQVEVSSWAPEIGSGKPLDAWLEAETGRVLDAYGNHPSFLLMAYGNEPGGKNHAKWLQDWVARRKLDDPRRLYTTASGWPIRPGSDYHSSPDPRIQGWGQGLKSIINSQPPRTDFDWGDFVKKHPDAPVISHEIGQWCVYPNFQETQKYNGYFKARNFEIFEETARRAGLLDQARDFVMASGKLQALAYKHDIEAALRTPRFGGFQLLDLHDFPGQGTALVGVLDAFWDEKGYVSPAEFSRFCGPVVPLARMQKLIWTTDETLVADVELAHFGPQDFKALAMTWSLTTSDRADIARGTLPDRDLAAGDLYQIGQVRVPLDKVKAPAKLVLTIGAPGGQFTNSWDIFVYPTGAWPVVPQDLLVTRDCGDAQRALAHGDKVLWLPPAGGIRNDPEHPLVAGFSPIFWNTAWTNWQPPHTLGILCNPQHPAFAKFPTDAHSNWQWWEIQKTAQPFILTNQHDLKPLVQVIDDWFTNRKLGYVFEAKVGAGRLLACSADLTATPDPRPVARQLLVSLLAYMQSPDFAPATVLTPEEMRNLLKPATP